VTIFFVIILLSTMGLEGRWWSYAHQVLLTLYFIALQGPIIAENIRKRKPGWLVDLIFAILIDLNFLGLITYQFVNEADRKFAIKWLQASLNILGVYIFFKLVIVFVAYLKSKREKTK
jgi:hypothetical protein